mgnify:CR=1 FL=1
MAETIITEGESGSALFVVLTGSIRITKSTLALVQEPEEVTIAELKAGSIFGEVSLISNRPRNTNALAKSPQVVVMKITTEIIEKFNLVIQKKFQTQLILTLVQRLDDMNSKYIKLKASIQKDWKHSSLATHLPFPGFSSHFITIKSIPVTSRYTL